MIVKKFNNDNLLRVPSFRMNVIGQTGSGKTIYIKNLFENHLYKQYKLVFVICPRYSNYTYKSINKKGSTFVFIETNKPDVICHFLEKWQLRRNKELKDRNQYGNIYKNHQKVLMIFDDVGSSKLARSQKITDLYCSFRHYGCSSIFLAQDFKSSFISTIMHNNTQFTVIFRTNSSKRNLEVIKECLHSDSRFLTLSTKESSKIIKDIIGRHIAPKYQAIICSKEQHRIFHI